MKIITKSVIDMRTMETIEEESFEYDGPLALCGGGGGSSYDKEYNRRMASIAESAQGISEDIFYYWQHGTMPPSGSEQGAAGDFYDRETNPGLGVNAANGYYLDKDGKYVSQDAANKLGPQTLQEYGYKWVDSSSIKTGTPGSSVSGTPAGGTTPGADDGIISQMELEQAQRRASNSLIPAQTENETAALGLSTAQANALKELLPDQTAAEKSTLGLTTAQNTAALGLLPKQTELANAKLDNSIMEAGYQAPVLREYYQKTLEGIDPKESMDAATADVFQAEDATKASRMRDAMAMGIAPGSERWNAMMKEDRNETVGAIADARTRARQTAEETTYSRLTNALGRVAA